MIQFYRFKRYAVYMLLGVMPMLVFMIIFISAALFIFIDPFYFIIAFLAGIITIAIIIFIGNRLLRHPIISMLEGKGLLSLIFDSTGLIASFNAIVNAPKMFGKTPSNPKEFDDTYDTDMMFRLLLPQDAPLTDAFLLKKDEKTGQIQLGEKKKVLVLPSDDKKFDHLFSFESRPTFIFNKVMNKFLSRDSLASLEKDILLKHNALNILNKIQETTSYFRDFGRYAGELTKPKQGFWTRNRLMKWIIIGAIVALIVFIIILFVPGFLNAFGGLGKQGIIPPSNTIP